MCGRSASNCRGPRTGGHFRFHVPWRDQKAVDRACPSPLCLTAPNNFQRYQCKDSRNPVWTYAQPYDFIAAFAMLSLPFKTFRIFKARDLFAKKESTGPALCLQQLLQMCGQPSFLLTFGMRCLCSARKLSQLFYRANNRFR